MGSASSGGKGGGGGMNTPVPAGLANINPQRPQFSQALMQTLADPYPNMSIQRQMNDRNAILGDVMNNPNIVSPYGNISYDVQQAQFDEPNSQLYKRGTQTITLSPDQQAQLDRQTGITKNLQNYGLDATSQLGDSKFSLTDLPQMPSSIDYSGVSAVPTMADYDNQRQGVQSAFMDQQRRLLDPIFSQNQNKLQNQLVNSGNPMDSTLYNTQIGNYQNQMNNSYLDAADQAIMQSYGIQNQLFNDANTTRKNQIDAAELPFRGANTVLGYRSAANDQLMKQISMALQGTPGIQTPTGAPFSATPNQAPDVPSFIDPINSMITSMYGTDIGALSNMYNTQSNNANQAATRGAQSANGMTSGLFSLGASLAPSFMGGK